MGYPFTIPVFPTIHTLIRLPFKMLIFLIINILPHLSQQIKIIYPLLSLPIILTLAHPPLQVINKSIPKLYITKINPNWGRNLFLPRLYDAKKKKRKGGKKKIGMYTLIFFEVSLKGFMKIKVSSIESH